mgnify:CR=1 FL=1
MRRPHHRGHEHRHRRHHRGDRGNHHREVHRREHRRHHHRDRRGNHRRHHRDGYRRRGRHGRDVRCPDARSGWALRRDSDAGACCPVPDAARHRDAGHHRDADRPHRDLRPGAEPADAEPARAPTSTGCCRRAGCAGLAWGRRDEQPVPPERRARLTRQVLPEQQVPRVRAAPGARQVPELPASVRWGPGSVPQVPPQQQPRRPGRRAPGTFRRGPSWARRRGPTHRPWGMIHEAVGPRGPRRSMMRT